LAKGWVAIATQTTTEKIFEKLFKNLLTNTSKCGIIKVQKERDGNPETRAAHESEVRPVPMTRPQGVRICGIQM
jgi:hypothetical protein